MASGFSLWFAAATAVAASLNLSGVVSGHVVFIFFAAFWMIFQTEWKQIH
jgi:hypothetical protein